MSFQENLKRYREQAGFKQAKEFAQYLGIPYTRYMAYENKGSFPNEKTLVSIATALHISIDKLLGYSTPDELKRKAVELQNLNISVEIIDDNVIVNKTAIFTKESFTRFVNSVHSIPVYRENVRKIWLDFLLYALSDDLFSNYRHLKESNELDPSSEKIITTMLDTILPEITNSDNDIIHKYLRNTPARLHCPTSSKK